MSELITGTLTADRLADLDPAELAGGTVELTEPLRFGADDERDLAFLAFLRDAMGHTVRVTWVAAGMPDVDPLLVSHLQPPRAVAAGCPLRAVGAVRAWQHRYAYGRCYYRRGPGFVTVRDARDPDANARYLIDEADAVAAFGATERVVHVPTAPEPVRELLALLAEERLAVRLGAHATLLPSRMRSWPVPFNVI